MGDVRCGGLKSMGSMSERLLGGIGAAGRPLWAEGDLGEWFQAMYDHDQAVTFPLLSEKRLECWQGSQGLARVERMENP